MRTPRGLLVGMLAALLLAASACSVSTDDDESSDDATDTSGDSNDSNSGGDGGEPARGVTDESIKLGLAAIDFEAIRETYGVDLGGLPDGIVEALVQATNDSGGINGRQIELVQRPFMPIGNEGSETACRELIEDEQVFAVVGMFLGDNSLCVTEANSTPYIALWGLDEERKERSNAPFITMQGEMGEQLEAGVDVLLDEGTLDDAKVAVYYEADVSESMVDNHVLGPMEDGGVDVVSSAQLPQTGGDAVQAGNEIDRIFQRFQADGADTLYLLSGAGVAIPALERTSWDPQIVVTNGQFTGEDSLGRYGLTNPAELEGALAVVAGNTSDDMVEDPELLECIDTINQYGGFDFKPVDIYPKSLKPESAGASQIVALCQLWELTVQVLTAAGDNPTADSIVDGLAELDDFDLPGFPGSSLSPDNWGAVHNTRLWNYDADQVRFIPDGAAVSAG